MADITDQGLVAFSNAWIRSSADRIERSYHFLKRLNSKWNALAGTDDDKFDILKTEVQRQSLYVAQVYAHFFQAIATWEALNLAVAYPNDASVLIDGAPGDGRGVITGADIHNVVDRMEEFRHWLGAGSLDVGVAAVDDSKLRDLIICSANPTTANAKTIAVDRAGELVTWYDTTNPTYLAQVQAVSVNGEL